MNTNLLSGKWWGNKDEVPLLGLHGWQDNAGTFDRLAPLLNITSFLAIDLPGHGFSSHLPTGKIYTFLDYLYALRRVVDHFKWKKYSILGHSFGSAIGFAHSSIFHDEVECFISIECARTLLLAYNTNISAILRQGIDKVLDFESSTTYKTPFYTCSDMFRMMIMGTLGSLSTPESVFALMKRGTSKHDAEKIPSVQAKKNVVSNLNIFIDHELSDSKESKSEKQLKQKKELAKMMESLEETLKLLSKTEGTDKYVYTFARDPRVKYNQFGIFSEDLIYESSRRITCPVLSLRGKQGYLQFASKQIYKNSNNIIKSKSVHFEQHVVEGNHHCHLNTPYNVAPVVNSFLTHCKKS